MKTILTVLALVRMAAGEEKHDPLENPRSEYSFSFSIPLLREGERERIATVNVEVSEAFLAASRKKFPERTEPYMVLSFADARMNPMAFPLKPSDAMIGRTDPCRNFEVSVPFDLLYNTGVDIQSVSFELRVPKKRASGF